MTIPLPDNLRSSSHADGRWVAAQHPGVGGPEGDRILVCTGRKKARNTDRDPRVAISMIDFQDP